MYQIIPLYVLAIKIYHFYVLAIKSTTFVSFYNSSKPPMNYELTPKTGRWKPICQHWSGTTHRSFNEVDIGPTCHPHISPSLFFLFSYLQCRDATCCSCLGRRLHGKWERGPARRVSRWRRRRMHHVGEQEDKERGVDGDASGWMRGSDRASPCGVHRVGPA
jgi:hypothetical protein